MTRRRCHPKLWPARIPPSRRSTCTTGRWGGRGRPRRVYCYCFYCIACQVPSAPAVAAGPPRLAPETGQWNPPANHSVTSRGPWSQARPMLVARQPGSMCGAPYYVTDDVHVAAPAASGAGWTQQLHALNPKPHGAECPAPRLLPHQPTCYLDQGAPPHAAAAAPHQSGKHRGPLPTHRNTRPGGCMTARL